MQPHFQAFVPLWNVSMYRKYSFSGPGAYYFKRPRTPATIGGPALIRGPALNISLKLSTPLFEQNCLRGFKIVR